MNEIRGTKSSNSPPAGRATGASTSEAGTAATPDATTATAAAATPDHAAISALAGQRPPASSKIALGAYPTGGPGGATFSSEGAKAPKEPGERVAVTTTTGDFEVQTAWGEKAGKIALTGVGVMANDQGAFVTVDDQGGVQLGGEKLDVGTGAPVGLPGGGTVSRGFDGGIGVRSAKGDQVSITAEGGRVGFKAVLANSRAANTIRPGGSED